MSLYTLGELSKETHVPPDADVILLVPSEDCLLTSVQLPAVAKRALRAAIPAALEEQLVEDIDTLHFAIGERQTDDTYPVAVVARAKMQAWLEVAESFGITPTQMLPDCFALPYKPDSWQIAVTETRCVIRTGAYNGFAASPAQLEAYLTLSPPTNSTRQIGLPKQICAPVLNLLQDTFQPKKRTAACQKTWWLTAKLVAGLFIWVFVWNSISWIYLNHQNQQLYSEIKHIYQHQFPAATAMVAPRERLLEKLQHAASQGNDQGFIALLRAISPILTTAPTLNIMQLNYHAPILTVNLTAQSFATLEDVVSRLNAAGIKSKQSNATTTPNGITATLIIQGKQAT